MPTFIKTGYWEKLQKGFKNYLNLDELIQSLSPPSAITADELDAIQSANAPDAGNPFATMDDISDCCVVVSQTEPTNPSDGLLWYKPDLCLTTTTTTCICEYINAPAPIGVSLVSDSAETNPVTWYYKCFYNHMGDDISSIYTEEQTVVIGEDTTEIYIIGGFPLPEWATGLDFILGSTSGIYNKFSYDTTNGSSQEVLIFPFQNNNDGYWDNRPKVQINTCYIDAPAPENITITPDAVGSNPVTWYYRAIYGTGNPSPTNISLVTEESSFIIGDSTNEIILDGAIIPSWASYITLILGTISGNYPYSVGASLFPTDIFELWIDFGYGNLYPIVLTIPIHQDWNGCGDEPTTTTSTPQ